MIKERTLGEKVEYLIRWVALLEARLKRLENAFLMQKIEPREYRPLERREGN